jgi:hypothetical protein
VAVLSVRIFCVCFRGFRAIFCACVCSVCGWAVGVCRAFIGLILACRGCGLCGFCRTVVSYSRFSLSVGRSYFYSCVAVLL